VARNRKRAKERRSRRPAGGAAGQPGLATARTQRAEQTPDPLEQATPDVELAEAQMALGRPELARDPEPVDDLDPGDDQPVAPPALQFEARGDDDELDAELGRDADGELGGEGDAGDGRGGGAGSELAASGAPPPQSRARPGNRLVNFLQGSWRELQRVQWPDRRQVMQATGVVIGFVIVAGVFLGVADFLAGKLVNFILK
jgi:preprotein translocase subunit SecE